ncbi:CapA family protein [Candidatus Peregrinibacteria bacterium]|nr:CapA family protein [Candidatus Peregrinibacteria bacterium]
MIGYLKKTFFISIGIFLFSLLVFGNLESPITSGREIHSYDMVFRADPGVETALKDAGFTILSLANNHTPNFGAQGLRDTFQYLRSAEIQYVGAGENDTEAYAPVFVEKNGMTFAFFAYNDTDVAPDGYSAAENHHGTAFMNIDRMKKAVSNVDAQVDFVIVSMHSGKEYVAEPNISQTEFAHAAIDSGADLIIGHHPHVVQTAEKYQGKYIFYSLGNFVFDQMWSNETRLGLAVKFIFRIGEGISDISFLPVLIEDYARPTLLSGDAALAVLKRLGFPAFEKRSMMVSVRD